MYSKKRLFLYYVFPILVVFFVLSVPMYDSYIDTTLNASNAISTTSFSKFDKVKLGKFDFTVISQDNGVQLLADTVIGNELPWDTAKTAVSNIDDFGAMGKVIFGGDARLANKADFNNLLLNTYIVSNIPQVSNRWWLADADLSTDKKARYISADNNIEPTSIVTRTDSDASGKCTTREETATGWLYSENIVDENLDVVDTSNMKIKYSIKNLLGTPIPGGDRKNGLKTYSDTACTSLWTGPIDAVTFLANGQVATVSNGNLVLPQNTYGLIAEVMLGVSGIDYSKAGNTIDITTSTNNQCNLLPSGNTGANSWQWISDGASVPVSYRISIDDVKYDNPAKTCPGQAHVAENAGLRPVIDLDTSSIAFGKNLKRTFTTSSSITATYPTSDVDPTYLTFYNNTLSATLTSSADSVTGTTLKASVDAQNEIAIPVTIASNKEGTSYVSASATDINGNAVYGILDSLNDTNGIVKLNISNLLKAGESSFQLTLYQEDSGAYDTSYISTGTPITVNLMKSQNIEFDSGQTDNVIYGDTIILSSSLTTPLSEQANSDIMYVVESGNASILSQNYDKTTGKATATIKAHGGTGTFNIAINKNGDDDCGSASKKTMDIVMNKRKIDVQPVKPTRVFMIGDTMPSLRSSASNLVTGDTLPDTLIPTLQPLDGSATLPYTGSSIDIIGTWMMIYDRDILANVPGAFTDKYEITLKDYDDDPSFIFETSDNSISDSWVIVTPQPNANGWNHTDVTIRMDSAAISKGYSSIVLYNDENVEVKYGDTIAYNSETTGETPNITLRKDNGEETNKKTLDMIKIDKTKPHIVNSIENKDTWTKNGKKVTLIVNDISSGIDAVVVNQGVNPVTVTKTDVNMYTFIAEQNDTYNISVMDKAGNEEKQDVTVEKIDKTVLSLNAILENFTSPEHSSQNISLTHQVGVSGAKSLKVFYKRNASDMYTELEILDENQTTQTYVVKMNGFYEFELIDNTGTVIKDEVEVSDVTPPLPSTQITASLEDDPNVSYIANEWTNHNVVLSLKNMNTEIKGTITWKVQMEGSSTWDDVNGDTYVIHSDSWLNNRYTFKATSSLGGEEVVGASIRVKIDKEKPSVPVILDEDKYTSSIYYDNDVTIEGNTTAKSSGILQVIYAREGSSGKWQEMTTNRLSVRNNGIHDMYFKIIDDAGNESDVKGPLIINISKETPTISFSLNNDPLSEWLNSLTLGYFFKETVNVDITVDIVADIYYIIDTSDSPTAPGSNDARWVSGSSTSIVPDQKAMVYAKAITKSGKESIDSTIYYVYADESNPNIIMPTNYLNYSNNTVLEVEVNDIMSGLDASSLKYTMKDKTDEVLTLINGKAEIPLVDGVYDVIVQGKDNSGNIAKSMTNVKIDSIDPLLKDIQADNYDWADSRMIRFTASDSGSGLASNYPEVTNSKGNVAVIKDGNEEYHFISNINDTFMIEVQDQAGNKTVNQYLESKIGKDESIIQITAESDGRNFPSGAWTNKDVIFTINGGKITNTVTGYQLAKTNGILPQESDWQDISDIANNKHLVSSEQRNQTYYFRSLPDKATTNTAFILNIDKTAPDNVDITLTNINSNPVAKFIHALSFANWFKEAQKVSFKGDDNLCKLDELKFYYAEEHDGVTGPWKEDPKNLFFNDTDIILHSKAVDLAGNEAIASTSVKIDMIAPVILGAKDQGVYKQYYLPRFIEVKDTSSGIQSATYMKDNESATAFTDNVKIFGAGIYTIDAIDKANNEASLQFRITEMPSIDDIDGSDEAKNIIDQIQKELDDTKDKLDETEIDDVNKWIEDAKDKYEQNRKTVIENDDKTSKIEGIGDTNFDPTVELIVNPITESKLPQLPRKALYSYDVYLRKGQTIIQPNGQIKVYLPYPDTVEPIVYGIDEDNKVKEIKVVKEGEFIVFITDKLMKYAISNVEQESNEIKVPGPDGMIDTDDDVIAKPNDKGDKPIQKPDGSVEVPKGGNVVYPNDKVIQTPDGGILYPDGSLLLPDGTHYDKDGNEKDKVCSIEGSFLNIDTDKDGFPDVNIDYDNDCVADLNIDSDNDGRPNIDIENNGDGIADVNIDENKDGKAESNIISITDWLPSKDCEFNGFKYDTMSDIESNFGYEVEDEKKSNHQGGAILPKVSGAYTGDVSPMTSLLSMVLGSSLFLGILRKRK